MEVLDNHLDLLPNISGMHPQEPCKRLCSFALWYLRIILDLLD
jgi:hypothetical protein